MDDIRYRTAGGAVVTVSADTAASTALHRVVRAKCSGCGASTKDKATMTFERAAYDPKKWADKHARTCQAMA